MGQNLTFCTFWKKTTPSPRDKTDTLAEPSGMIVQRNNLRETSVIQPHETVQKDSQMRGLLQIQMESIMLDL
jgi:hypothetical protein